MITEKNIFTIQNSLIKVRFAHVFSIVFEKIYIKMNFVDFLRNFQNDYREKYIFYTK